MIQLLDWSCTLFDKYWICVNRKTHLNIRYLRKFQFNQMDVQHTRSNMRREMIDVYMKGATPYRLKLVVTLCKYSHWFGGGDATSRMPKIIIEPSRAAHCALLIDGSTCQEIDWILKNYECNSNFNSNNIWW